MSIESPTNRDEFITHCKKRISFLSVNITPDQEKILVEKAKKKFLDYHRESTEKVFVAQVITQEDLDRGYFITPDEVYTVNSLLSYRSAVSMAGSVFASIGASFAWGNTLGLYNGNILPSGPEDTASSPMINYFLAKMSANLYDSHFNRADIFQWNRTNRHLRIIGNPNLEVGKYIVYEADISLEADERFWQVEWFIEYTSNLFKKHWGENLSKFANVELPGGMQLNAQEIKTEARDRLVELEEELQSMHSDYQMIYIS